jgi:hypothetical protein
VVVELIETDVAFNDAFTVELPTVIDPDTNRLLVEGSTVIN